jgi:hypothetical protein
MELTRDRSDVAAGDSLGQTPLDEAWMAEESEDASRRDGEAWSQSCLWPGPCPVMMPRLEDLDLDFSRLDRSRVPSDCRGQLQVRGTGDFACPCPCSGGINACRC